MEIEATLIFAMFLQLGCKKNGKVFRIKARLRKEVADLFGASVLSKNQGRFFEKSIAY